MTKNEIAKVILERRARMTHVIIPGEINSVIGADGVSEALRDRWLVPDTDSGYLCVTNEPHKVQEMIELAGSKPEDALKAAPILVTDSHDISLAHTKRRHLVQEIAAPGTGQPSPGLSSIAEPQPPMNPAQPPVAGTAAPVAPAAPAAPIAAGGGGGGAPGLAVGSAVTVARQGVAANGVIEKLLPDGRYSIGYGADVRSKPPGDNVFSKDEMTLVPRHP